MVNFAVALGGGGARGIYQIGALKAILEMGIKITAVAGTSIGSINGAVFVQGDIHKADDFWQGIKIEQVIDLSKNIILNKGADHTPLKELLAEIIDEKRIRESKIDFGLTTFSVTNKEAVELFIEEIPSGKLVEYLLASSCFPGFKLVEINGKEYIDGGITNKMPVAMLVARGYKDIIAIDINGPGFSKATDTYGVNIITVKNPRKLTGIFDFNPEKLEKAKKIGYLDAYKTFGKLYGQKYYFKTEEYEKLRGRYSTNIINGLEICAQLLSLDNARTYGAQEFLEEIKDSYMAVRVIYDEIKEKLFTMNLVEIIKNWKNEEILKQGIILPLLVDLIKENRGGITNVTLKKIAGKKFEAAGCLIVISDTEDTSTPKKNLCFSET